jgi:triphosphoribosyl-dephospho-CoA synthase
VTGRAAPNGPAGDDAPAESPPFAPRLALASLSGESDAAWARRGASEAGAAFLGGIALDGPARDAARDLVARDRVEFLPPDPFAWIDDQLSSLSDAPIRPGVNVRATTPESVRRAAEVCADHGAILEVNAHCRQEELCAVGCGEALLADADRLVRYVEAAAGTGATVSMKARTEVDGVDLPATAAAVADAGADLIHVDAMDSEGVVAQVVEAVPTAFVVANNEVRDARSVREYLAYGADAVSVGRPSDDPRVRRRVRDAVESWFDGAPDGSESADRGDASEVIERGPAANAELALLLEVAGTPKPGNVDRHRDLADLRFEHFLAGAVGARPGLERAAAGDPVGASFETAVAGMSQQSGGNTQFGCLLLLVPLVAATGYSTEDVDGNGDGDGDQRDDAASRSPTRESVRAVCEATTVDDAAAFYRAFEHVDVAVADPPAGMEPLDVRRGADAVPVVRDRGLTLFDLMARSADHDGNAAEWVEGFQRVFDAADGIVTADGPLTERAARAFLDLLADEPDTLVRTDHGADVAREVSERAAEIESLSAAEAWAEDLAERGINPGTTADAVAAALYVALSWGVEV